jgi:hypothetical protein
VSVRPLSIHFCASAFLLVAFVAPAAADPIRLTDGIVNYSRSNAAIFRTVQPVTIDVLFGSDGGHPPSHTCFGCLPGTPINVSQRESFGPPAPGELGDLGVLTIKNVIYSIDAMDFQIDAGTATIPSVPSGVDGGPFLFHASLRGTSSEGMRRTFDFFGTGRVRIDYIRDGGFGGIPSWFATTYAFAPTPEPGTWLLLGTGLAFGLARHRRHGSPRP